VGCEGLHLSDLDVPNTVQEPALERREAEVVDDDPLEEVAVRPHRAEKVEKIMAVARVRGARERRHVLRARRHPDRGDLTRPRSPLSVNAIIRVSTVNVLATSHRPALGLAFAIAGHGIRTIPRGPTCRRLDVYALGWSIVA
jgi:hypothetical protein